MFPSKSQDNIFIDGMAGKLELITTFIDSDVPYVAIVCHPHPLFLGTMHNKVVTTLVKSVKGVMPTVRFNFRGVGKSDGAYGGGIGEVDDLLAVIAWVKQCFSSCKIILMGFSFGAGIAASVANMADMHDDVSYLVTIAPSVDHSDFYSFTAIQCPWLLLFAGSDEVVDVAKTRSLVQDPPSPISQVIEMSDASHFFHGELIVLEDHIKSALLSDLGLL
jgi:uncharacterized protein